MIHNILDGDLKQEFEDMEQEVESEIATESSAINGNKIYYVLALIGIIMTLYVFLRNSVYIVFLSSIKS